MDGAHAGRFLQRLQESILALRGQKRLGKPIIHAPFLPKDKKRSFGRNKRNRKSKGRAPDGIPSGARLFEKRVCYTMT